MMFKNNPYVILLRLYWRFVPNKKNAILFMAMQVIVKSVYLLKPFVFGSIINYAQIGGPAMRDNIMPYVIVIILIPFVERCLHGPARKIENMLAFEATQQYKLHLYHMAISLPMQRHTDNHSGDTIDKISKASDALKSFSSDIYTNVGAFISFFGAIVALILLRPITIVVVCVLGAIMIAVVTLFDKHITQHIKDENKKENKVNALLVDYLSNIRTLITLRFLKPTESTLSSAIDDVKPHFKKHIVKNERKWFAADMTLETTVVVLFIVYMYLQWSKTGAVALGSVTMLWQYVQNMSYTFYNVTYSYGQIMRYSANIAGVSTIEDDYKQSVVSQLGYPSIAPYKRIDIHNLTFTYKQNTAQSTTLHNVDMSLHAGEKIAVVGESGSGKSTFLSLMRGLYDVDSVKVSVDGSMYNNLHILAESTSLIPQEPEIFEETMLFNISMGSDVSQEEVERFAKIACFHDIALGLPHGYETNIKEKGVNLSGGQKQRLALARGLMAAQNSQLVLLDESTSSVDSINEKKIYTNIFSTFAEKTVVAAIHKLHLLPMFDTIYVFEKGRIVESGSFDALVSIGGVFARMRDEYSIDMQREDEKVI